MNGRDFLDTARSWAGRGREADERSAVSRAYYACFHVARDFLAALRFRTPRADRAHNYLYVRLNNCGLRHVEGAAIRLDILRGLRNQADYDLHRPLSSSAAPDSIADAEFVIRTLDALSPQERTHISAAMRQYEQKIGDVTWQP